MSEKIFHLNDHPRIQEKLDKVLPCDPNEDPESCEKRVSQAIYDVYTSLYDQDFLVSSIAHEITEHARKLGVGDEYAERIQHLVFLLFTLGPEDNKIILMPKSHVLPDDAVDKIITWPDEFDD